VAPLVPDTFFSSFFFLAIINTDSFYAYSNRIEGPLPSEIGLLGLSELQLFQNRMSSVIPEELYNNVDLTLLRLDLNSFSGTISSSIGNLVSLKQLWMNNNTLGGGIPATIARLSNLGTSFLNYNGSLFLFSTFLFSLTSSPAFLFATQIPSC